MCLVDFVDVVSQLPSAPVLKTMHCTAIFRDDVIIQRYYQQQGQLFWKRDCIEPGVFSENWWTA